ncbi:phage baseplate protein [Halobacterium salinarum]|uniref:phage baseplate protein n=1 Tax=Halobacterium salinarum TaxID=2242 RepID=UPI0025528FD0|nr:hypothetical protein [Halobacterium salinarum]MDL0127063.1 hypothetical protein [Halobacterium salinarum]
MPRIDRIGESPTVVTIGDLVLPTTTATDSGGWNSPSKRTEEGYDYDSYIRPEPVEVSLEAWVPVEDYNKLKSLRQSGEPFPASIGKQASFAKAKLESLDVANEQGQSSHYKVSLTIKEIREASIETAEISIETDDGSSMGSAASTTEPSTAQSEESDGGQTEDGTGGIVGTLAGIRQSLAGVL